MKIDLTQNCNFNANLHFMIAIQSGKQLRVNPGTGLDSKDL